ncbi:MAG: DUF1402 family protein [Bdellovibrionota bacterium]
MNIKFLSRKKIFCILGSILAMTLIAAGPSISVRDICAYDPWCGNLVNGSELKEPDQALVSLLRRHRAEIHKQARLQNVDPRAITGAILAENTLNIGKTDQIQDFLVNTGIAKNGKLPGYSFTYGLGQIKCERAQEVDRYFAKRDGRQVNKSICTEISNANGSIKVVAMALRQAIDVYKANGIDISSNIGVQTTLYNIGSVEKKAAAAKAKKATPRINYFGWFVENHNDEIVAIVGAPAAPKPAATAKTPGAPIVAEEAPDEKVQMRPSLTKVTTLMDAPPLCGEKYQGIDKTPKQISSKTMARPGKYSELGRAVDCEMRAWSLVRTDEGAVGWIKQAELKSSTTRVPSKGPLTCESTDSTCARGIMQKEKRYLIDTDENLGTVDLQISSNNGGNRTRQKVSTAEYWGKCGAAALAESRMGTSEASTRVADVPVSKLTEAQINELKKAVQKKIKELPSDFTTYVVAPLYDMYTCKQNCVGNFESLLKHVTDLSPSNVRQIEAPSLRIETPSKPGLISFAEFKSKFDSCNVSRELEKIRVEYQAAPKEEMARVKHRQEFYWRLDSLSKNMSTLAKAYSSFKVDLTLSESLRSALNYCEMLAKRRGESSANTEAQANCTDCAAKGSSNTSKAMEDVAFPLLETDILSGLYGNVDYTKEMKKTIGVQCNYNFGETVSRMRALLQSSCVEKMYMPDAVTYEIFKNIYPEKVAFRQFPKKDQFTVQVKSICEEKKE